MIVFVEQDPASAFPSRRIFYKMRVHTRVIRPDEIGQLPEWPVKAIIVARPGDIEEISLLCDNLRALCPGVPLAAFPEQFDKRYLLYEDKFDRLYGPTVTSTRVVTELFTEYEERTGKQAFSLIVEGAKTDIRKPNIFCLFGAPYRVSGRHYLILRYLALCAPRKVPAEELLEVCFPPQNQPDVSNVSVQVCLLNRYSNLLCPDYPIVSFKRGEGYYITPHYIRRPRK